MSTIGLPAADADGSGAAASAEVPTVAVAAIDLGATSGRVMLGIARAGDPARLDLHEAHRFPNDLLEEGGTLRWDADSLWENIRSGLREAQRLAVEHGPGTISSIAIDSWAVDYALIGPDGDRLGEIIAYRDSRTDGVAERVAGVISRQRQYEATGIAQQPFNTLYQLAAESRLADLPDGATLLMVPDHVAFLLTGERRTELTNASSTGMLSAADPEWVPELIDATGAVHGSSAGVSLFAPLVAPGERIGTVLPDVAAELGLGEVPVVAAASHDTASAVLAVPAEPGGTLAYISSGTWSLIGLELPEPITTEEARTAGFTNERGIDGTFRFLKNVAGMWLVTESIRQWEESGAKVDLGDLLSAAAAVPGDRFRIDPTDPEFIPPGRMADRVVAAAEPLAPRDDDPEAESPRRPSTPAEIVRCILESLAVTYASELRSACRLAGRAMPDRLHVVGGGSRNALLNQLTADALGIKVIAGPVEATALGNVAVQARALGLIGAEPGAMRAAVRSSVELEVYTPNDGRHDRRVNGSRRIRYQNSENCI